MKWNGMNWKGLVFFFLGEGLKIVKIDWQFYFNSKYLVPTRNFVPLVMF